MSTGMTINADASDGTCIVQLAGTLDLSLGDHTLVPSDQERVVFDFDGVRRITSFGILMWTRALEALQAEYIAMARCRPSIVQQLNVVSNFVGPCEVLSIYLPFACEPCDREFDVLWELADKHAHAVRRSVPDEKCPKCGGPAEFDDVPRSYFAFADRIPAPNPPSSVSHRLLSAYLRETSQRPSLMAGRASAPGMTGTDGGRFDGRE